MGTCLAMGCCVASVFSGGEQHSPGRADRSQDEVHWLSNLENRVLQKCGKVWVPGGERTLWISACGSHRDLESQTQVIMAQLSFIRSLDMPGAFP